MTPTLRIETLGRCAAIVNGKRVEPSSELVFAALLLLGLDRGRRWSRADFADMLWPDADYSTQGSRLRWLLTKLRSLGVPIENRSAAIVVRSSDIHLDVEDIDQLDPEAIGDALPGYAPDLSPKFAKWLEERRDQLGAMVLECLVPRLHDLVRRRDWASMRPLANAVLRFDPLNEDAQFALAESQRRLGLTTQAVVGLERYIAALDETSSDSRVRATLLLRRLRNVGNVDSGAAEPRFVGRSEHLARIDGIVSAAQQGRGSALMLLGPAGIGKTRLLDEASVRARILGMRVLRIRCQRGDVERPLSGIVDLAQKLMTMRGAAGCRPENLSRLRALTEAASPVDDSSGQQHLTSPKLLRARLAAALVDLLDAVSAEGTVIVQVDDAQWLDPSLTWMWDRFFSWSSTHHVAWLFAHRSSRRDIPSLSVPGIQVGALDPESALVLIDNLLMQFEGEIPASTRDSLLARGAGSPLFLRELVRQWRAGERIDALPGSLLALFENGLASLSRSALRTLQVAAILGTRATLERIEFVVQMTRSAFVDALTELENAGILTTDASGATYGHVLWSEAAMATLSSNISRLLHRHAAERFEQELADAPSATLLWESARHWELAGYGDRARRATLQGAEHLARNGFPGDAANVFGRVIHDVSDPVERLPLMRRRMTLLGDAGRWGDVVKECELHERLADELDPHHDSHSEVELLRFDAMIAHETDHRALIEHALTCGRDTTATSSHRLQALRQCARAGRGSSPVAIEEAHDLARWIEPVTVEDSLHRLRVEWEYELRRGSVEKAAALVTREMELVAGWSRSPYYPRSLEHGAFVYVVAGRLAEAGALYRRAIDILGQFGALGGLAFAYDGLIGIALDIDSLDMIRTTLAAARKSLQPFDSSAPGCPIEFFLGAHHAQFALLTGRPEQAKVYAAPLEWCRAVSADSARARLLAIHLEIQGQLEISTGADELAQEVRRCFDKPDIWLDWPASVYARYLERVDRVSEAAEFSHWYISTIRRELYPVPDRCGALTRLAAMLYEPSYSDSHLKRDTHVST